jgi:hypothetical protein
VATALGPFAGAAIASVTGSYPATFVVLAALAAAGSLLSVQGVRRAPRPVLVAD